MRVLHIAGGFAQQSLYANLVQELRAIGYRQDVFVPVRSEQELMRQPADIPGELYFHFERVLRPYHRVCFRRKVNTIRKRLLGQLEPGEFDIVHAHTLYSDGAVALALCRSFGLPYIAAIRGTDVNYFMRLRPDLGRMMEAVIAAAGATVFISPAYRISLLNRFSGRLRDRIVSGSVVIPNGVPASWLEGPSERASSPADPLRLLYVGSFVPRKNVAVVLDAVAIVAQRRPVEFSLVGSGGRCERRILEALAAGRYPFARYLGRVADPDALRAIYRAHDIFVMPSIRETFGIVYLEALSQGLPIVYSKGQGIDGYFSSGTVAEGVDPHNVDQIAERIQVLASRLGRIRPVCRAEASRFAWVRVAEQYDKLYQAVILSKG